MAKKKTSNKRLRAPEGTEGETVESTEEPGVGLLIEEDLEDVDNLQFATKERGPSKYQPLADRVKALKYGRALMLHVPEGKDPQKYLLGVGSQVRRLLRDSIGNDSVGMRFTADGRIAVQRKKDGARKRAARAS